MKILIAVFSVAISLLCACEGPDISSDSMTFEQFVGTYHANFGSAKTEKITFNVDSTYVYTYIDTVGNEKSHSGTYEFVDAGRNSYTLVIERFPLLHPRNERCIDHKPIVSDTIRWIVRVVKQEHRQFIEHCPSQFKYYIKRT